MRPSEMEVLVTAVAEKSTVDAAVIAFINGVGPMIEATAGDKQASLDLASEISTRKTAITAAILANTPVPPTSPEVKAEFQRSGRKTAPKPQKII